ncbi:MAG: lysophospholipase [Leptolyngbya sp. SIOISBB]|nr:lysophospholipase [Leptolyngbya sp. SIOISBB]
MAAEVCLLLMQSLVSDCDTTTDVPTITPPATIAPSEREAAGADVTRDSAAIAPAVTRGNPQFTELCERADANRLAVCVLSDVAPASPPAQTAAAPLPVTHPMPLNLPTAQRSLPAPVAQPPQFSSPPAIAANPATPVRLPSNTVRPSNGSELYRQRQLALQSGRSYTRLAPDAYANQWRTVSRQPTYEDWKGLLSQEARAMSRGQGSNRLEVIVGDSFGLWLPPEMLPRDRLWLNQSISGDTTAGILQRVSTFAHTRATTIHLMAGANDLKNGVPEAQIVSNLQRTVRILQRQHPQAQIIVYSVLPTRRAEIGNDRVRSLNTQLARMTQQSAVEYRDLHPSFRDEWGHLRPDLTTDGLHLNPQGYALWQQAILARAL